MRGALPLVVLLISCTPIMADWPQWRGPNRDARASGFEAPATWPEQLTEKWQQQVGIGVASPSLVGDKLYVFSRQDGNEILRCLNAGSGDEIWRDQYEAEAVRGPASSFDGPRSSPTVTAGKVVTLGAQGMLSCYDAESGEVAWRNDSNVGKIPRFATSSSPIVVDDLVIAEYGADEDGGLAAYDLNTGDEKWKWTGSGATYGSPVQMALNGVDAIVSPMSDKLVIVAAADGKQLMEMPYSQGRYNSATPIVSGDVLILAGPNSGMTAFKFTADGDQLAPEEVWKNNDNSVGFNTPVVKDGKLYGISNLNSLFCINVDNGETLWNSPLGSQEESQADGGERRSDRGAEGDRPRRDRDGESAEGRAEGERAARGPNGEGRRRGRGGRRGGRGGGGYGSVVDAGSALLALIPGGQLTVFAPGDEFSQLATFKVAEGGAYAYPVPSEHGLFIKDQESVKLLTTE